MLVQTFKAFLDDTSGATAIEYALLGVIIAIGIVATFAALGTSLENLFNNGASDVIANQTAKL